MTNVEFKSLLKEAFSTHTIMQGRDYHTINELLHCLRYNDEFKNMNFNISIVKTNGEWWAIPTIDSFVNMNTLSIWFDDDKVEYDIDSWDDGDHLIHFDCITVYERVEK